MRVARRQLGDQPFKCRVGFQLLAQTISLKGLARTTQVECFGEVHGVWVQVAAMEGKSYFNNI